MKNTDCKQLFVFCAAFALLCGCTKRYEFPSQLSLTAKNITLNMYEGESRIVVYSNTSWSAKMVREVNWGSLEGGSGSGIGDVLFTFRENPSIPRKASVAISAGSARDTVTFVQAGAITSPAFGFKESILTIDSSAGEYQTGFDTDIPDLGELIAGSVVYYFEGDPLEEVEVGENVPKDFPVEGWIRDFRYEDGKIIVSVTANDSDQKRSADFFAILDNGLGIYYKTSLRIRQSANI